MKTAIKTVANEIHFNKQLNPDLQFEALDLQFLYQVKKDHHLSDPQRVHFYLLILVEKGQGHHMVDFTTYKVHEGSLILVQPGQVQAFLSENKIFGPLVVFTKEFLHSLIGLDTEMHQLNSLLQNMNSVVDLSTQSEKKLIIAYQKAKVDLFSENTFKTLGGKLAALNFFISLSNIKEIKIAKGNAPDSDDLVQKFYELLEENYVKQRAATFYANALHITTRTLDRRLKQELGETCKTLHARRLLLECKRHLTKLDRSIKDISNELQFSDSAAFSRFFKQESTMSPFEFREALVNGNLNC